MIRNGIFTRYIASHDVVYKNETNTLCGVQYICMFACIVAVGCFRNWYQDQMSLLSASGISLKETEN